jgi:hypothetical protein
VAGLASHAAIRRQNQEKTGENPHGASISDESERRKKLEKAAGCLGGFFGRNLGVKKTFEKLE